MSVSTFLQDLSAFSLATTSALSNRGQKHEISPTKAPRKSESFEAVEGVMDTPGISWRILLCGQPSEEFC